uniref:Uncharacterized protein n=1 Tax=Macrostomum lignano TaxID=282301 RepID=A0A1I8GTF2_9PLAT
MLAKKVVAARFDCETAPSSLYAWQAAAIWHCARKLRLTMGRLQRLRIACGRFWCSTTSCLAMHLPFIVWCRLKDATLSRRTSSTTNCSSSSSSKRTWTLETELQILLKRMRPSILNRRSLSWTSRAI